MKMREREISGNAGRSHPAGISSSCEGADKNSREPKTCVSPDFFVVEICCLKFSDEACPAVQ